MGEDFWVPHTEEVPDVVYHDLNVEDAPDEDYNTFSTWLQLNIEKQVEDFYAKSNSDDDLLEEEIQIIKTVSSPPLNPLGNVALEGAFPTFDNNKKVLSK